MNKKLVGIFLMFIFIIAQQSMLYAGGYVITDREGKVISEQSGKTLKAGPADKIIAVYDKNDRKVFDIRWDADEKSLVVKGDAVELKIFDDGRIEKWTSYEDQQEQQPVIIEPVVPVTPKKRVR